MEFTRGDRLDIREVLGLTPESNSALSQFLRYNDISNIVQANADGAGNDWVDLAYLPEFSMIEWTYQVFPDTLDV